MSSLRDDRETDHRAIERLTSKLQAQASFQAGQEKALRVIEHSDSEKDIRMTGLNWDQDVPREGLSRNTVSHILARISGLEVTTIEQTILDFRVLGPPKQKELPNGRILPRSSPVIITLGRKTQRDYLLDKSRSHEDRSLPKLSVVFPERWQPEVNRLRAKGAAIYNETRRNTCVVAVHDRILGKRLVLQTKGENDRAWRTDEREKVPQPDLEL